MTESREVTFVRKHEHEFGTHCDGAWHTFECVVKGCHATREGEPCPEAGTWPEGDDDGS